jgi:hypothetical protein
MAVKINITLYYIQAEVTQQFFVKFCNIKFYENPFIFLDIPIRTEERTEEFQKLLSGDSNKPKTERKKTGFPRTI